MITVTANSKPVNIPGLTHFLISQNGDILNTKTGNLLTARADRNGKMRVDLNANGKKRSFYVENLVQLTFAPKSKDRRGIPQWILKASTFQKEEPGPEINVLKRDYVLRALLSESDHDWTEMCRIDLYTYPYFRRKGLEEQVGKMYCDGLAAIVLAAKYDGKFKEYKKNKLMDMLYEQFQNHRSAMRNLSPKEQADYVSVVDFS